MFDGRNGAQTMLSSLKHQLAAIWHTLRGRHSNALAHHHATLDHDPAHWSALYAAVAQLRREGRDTEALAVAERALASEPSHFLALQTAACLSVKLARYHDAKRHVERALDAMPAIRPGSWALHDMFVLLAWRIARLVRGERASRNPPEPLWFVTARYLDDWKQWASDYLAWYQVTYSAGQTSAHR